METLRPYEIRVSARTNASAVVYELIRWLEGGQPIYFAAIGPRCVATVLTAVHGVYQRTGRVVAVSSRLVRRRLPTLALGPEDPLWVVTLLFPHRIDEDPYADVHPPGVRETEASIRETLPAPESPEAKEP